MSKYALVKKGEPVEGMLSEEVAREQLMEFLGYYDIDLGRVSDETVLKQGERQLDHLVSFIREGRLEIRRNGANEAVEVVHKLTNGAEVVYGELNAAAKLAMDKYPAQEQYNRLYALMGSLGGIGKEGVMKYKARDLAIVDLLGAVFMSA